MSGGVLKFDAVTKVYGGVGVLDGVSFNVDEGDVVGIFGRSGSGKSTLLRIAAGLAEPTSGTFVSGARRVGFVFQEPRLLPWKTALDNVAIPLQAAGHDVEASHENARSWLAGMGLSDFEQYYPAKLSGGMAQRVSLARAFAIEPDVLLLDEPFGALDINLRDAMLDLLSRLLETKPVTVLYVSHVPEDVVRVATRILVLERGVMRELPMMGEEALVDELRKSFEQ